MSSVSIKNDLLSAVFGEVKCARIEIDDRVTGLPVGFDKYDLANFLMHLDKMHVEYVDESMYSNVDVTIWMKDGSFVVNNTDYDECIVWKKTEVKKIPHYLGGKDE